MTQAHTGAHLLLGMHLPPNTHTHTHTYTLTLTHELTSLGSRVILAVVLRTLFLLHGLILRLILKLCVLSVCVCARARLHERDCAQERELRMCAWHGTQAEKAF